MLASRPRWMPGRARGARQHGARMPGTTLARPCSRGEHGIMRYESSVTSVSWIPSEAFDGILQYGIESLGHYDDPLPDVLGDLEEWRGADKFRVANRPRDWVEAG